MPKPTGGPPDASGDASWTVELQGLIRRTTGQRGNSSASSALTRRFDESTGCQDPGPAECFESFSLVVLDEGGDVVAHQDMPAISGVRFEDHCVAHRPPAPRRQVVPTTLLREALDSPHTPTSCRGGLAMPGMSWFALAAAHRHVGEVVINAGKGGDNCRQLPLREQVGVERDEEHTRHPRRSARTPSSPAESPCTPRFSTARVATTSVKGKEHSVSYRSTAHCALDRLRRDRRGDVVGLVLGFRLEWNQAEEFGRDVGSVVTGLMRSTTT